MLLTDMWEALEYTNLEPGPHILLRPIAAFFGMRFAETEKPKNRPPNDEVVGAWMGMFGGAKPAEATPHYLRDNPTLKQMFADMKKGKKNG